jgi:hypothetical protein
MAAPVSQFFTPGDWADNGTLPASQLETLARPGVDPATRKILNDDITRVHNEAVVACANHVSESVTAVTVKDGQQLVALADVMIAIREMATQ